MIKEQLVEKRNTIGKNIETMRKDAEELEIAIRRNEGAYLQLSQLLEEMEKEEGEE